MKKNVATFVVAIVIIALCLFFLDSKNDKETFYIPSSLEKVEAKIDKNEDLNIYIYKNGCSTCIYFAETVKRNQIISNVYGINLDDENSMKFLEKYDIMSTPTVMRFAKGKVLTKSSDIKKEKQLIEFFNE